MPEPKNHTAEITIKMTSPTLVDFQQQRQVNSRMAFESAKCCAKTSGKRRSWRRKYRFPSVQIKRKIGDFQTVRQKRLVINGANALKAEIVCGNNAAKQQNATLSSALQRIEESRQKFLEEEKHEALPTILDTAGK